MINLDDIPISNWGLRVQKEHDHPAIGEMRTRTITIPGMAGQWDFGSELGAKPFSFPLGFIEYDMFEKQRRLNEFVAFLFDQYGRPRNIKLSFDYAPKKYYFVKVSNGFSPKRVFGFAFFELSLIASDPYAYAEMNAYDIPSNYDQAEDGMYYENTQSFQWIYSQHYSGVYNYSTLEAPLILEIEGTMLNPSITHIESGKKLILPSIYSSRTIEIDSSKYTIKSNGYNILFETNEEFIALFPKNNGFLFEAESPNATVTYKWKHKFI